LQIRHGDPVSDWEEAMCRAVEGASGGEGILLAYESREDLAVEANGEEAEPSVRWTRVRGLSARGPFARSRELHRSDPGPDDAKRLLGAAIDPDAAVPMSTGPTGREDEVRPELPVGEACELARRLVARTLELQPRATVVARWVGFDQRVRLARPGRPPVADLRRGRRIRLEARAGREVAVAEAVLDAGEPVASREVDGWCAAVARRLEERKSSGVLGNGEYRVVFAPGVGGVLVHEVVGHALEADVVFDGASWLGQARAEVADRRVVVLDDPRRARASWKVDDDGEVARAVSLVSGGRVAGRLYDLRSAVRAGRPSTGHGRRASYRDAVQPRMGCTFVAPGDFHPEEVLAGIDTGIYVRRMEVATTDPRTGRAVFRVTDADRIARGRIEGPLVPHLLVAEGRRALSTMDRVANDVAFDTCVGTCVREGQALATSVGAPTFRIGLTSALF
jgi:TldD protein